MTSMTAASKRSRRRYKNELATASCVDARAGRDVTLGSAGDGLKKKPRGYYRPVFGLSVELGPLVETRPTSGKVGKRVAILGTNLTGATSVAFNGTLAAFTVESKTAITTTVPTGATSGPVQLTTPRDTFTSKAPFRVIP